MILSPKNQFLRTKDAKAVADMVANPALQRGLEVALAEMHLSVGKSSDAASNWHQLEGAKRFISILLNIADPPTPTRRGSPRENLKS